MQDPLNKEQLDYFFVELRKEFERRYERALENLNPEDWPVAADSGSFLLAKCVFMREADEMILGPDSRELLQHLRESRL